MDVNVVRADLLDEQQALDVVVGSLSTDDWAMASASPRWSVADQIGHLTFFDRAATLAIVDPAAFSTQRDELIDSLADPGLGGAQNDPGLGGAQNDGVAVDDATLSTYRAMTPTDLLAAWRAGRDSLAAAAARLTNEMRVEWYGPSMSSKSFLTARLMEVWAHGQDVVDAVGATRPATDRIHHIAQLGFITRRWSYLVRGMTPPERDVRVELSAPSGATWTWGPDDATDRVAGPAEDFCLVVTQRRHVDDTSLATEGDAARDWMLRAQAFAGSPTTGPVAGSRG